MIERIATGILVRCDERGESRERSATTLLMSRVITEHNTDIAQYSTPVL